MNDDQYLLANAYVDGEITDEDREIAERDPAVMTEVAVLRAVRAAIADVPAPAEESKRRAIAAAMAEFDRAGIPAQPPEPDGTAISMRAARQRRSMRWLQVAAAVTAIGLGGIVVSRGLGGGDDDEAGGDDSALTESAAVEPAGEPAVEPVPENADEQAAEPAAEPAEGRAEEPASEDAEFDDGDDADADRGDGMGDDVAEATVDTAATADEAEEGALVEFAEGGYAAQLDLALPGRTSRTPITTSDDLLEYAVAVSEAAAAGRPEPELPFIGDCDIDEPILADAFVDDGTGPNLALIGIDDRLLVARAYDRDTCEVLLET